MSNVSAIHSKIHSAPNHGKNRVTVTLSASQVSQILRYHRLLFAKKLTKAQYAELDDLRGLICTTLTSQVCSDPDILDVEF